MSIGYVLYLSFGFFCPVFAEAFFLRFFHLFNCIAADIPDRNFGLLAFCITSLHKFPSSFLSQRWKK